MRSDLTIIARFAFPRFRLVFFPAAFAGNGRLHPSLAERSILFFEKGSPEWLSTTDVLEFLHTVDNRPWDTWTKDKPMQPN